MPQKNCNASELYATHGFSFAQNSNWLLLYELPNELTGSAYDGSLKTGTVTYWTAIYKKYVQPENRVYLLF